MEGEPPDLEVTQLRETVDTAIEELVLGAERKLDRREVAEAAGVSLERAIRFWRAMGFPDVSDGVPAFTSTDVDMLRRVTELVASGVVEEDVTLQIARVMGRAASRIATAQVEVLRGWTQGDEVEEAATVGLERGTETLDDLETFLVYLWRRHLAAVTERQLIQALMGTDPGSTAVVGFADLVGFTASSQRMDERELAEAISAFETTAYDVIAAQGGRVVKMLGDEVMFSAPDAPDAAETGLRLVEAFLADERMPDVRVGLAAGAAVPHHGDIFGPAPNLASRLVDVAYPGTALVSADVRDAVEADERYFLKAVSPQRLKGFGRTPLWVLRRNRDPDDP